MNEESLSFKPPRGMRDFYPEDMALQRHIFDAWEAASRRFGFLRYDACVVESLDVLKRKSGEEILRQIYAFKDKSGRDLALRPEMTPTLARMVAARFGALQFPLKWYTTAQCFRYERTTRGRKREHYQWNLDVIGETSVAAEAEVIAAAADALGALGLSRNDYAIRFSSRALLADILTQMDISEDTHLALFSTLDKKDKVENDTLVEMLKQTGLSGKKVDEVLDVMNTGGLKHVSSLLSDDCASYREVVHFKEIMDTYGLGDLLHFDLSVVRGLAYYTGIVFEAFDAGRKYRAIFGGGRYDNLLKDLTGKDAPAVGLGFGDVVVSEILKNEKRTSLDPQGATLAVGFMSENERKQAITLAASLRSRKVAVDLSLAPEKPRNFFSRCGKAAYQEAVYIGPDDVTEGKARIKNLETRTEREVSLTNPDY